jgi:hypothetical protein
MATRSAPGTRMRRIPGPPPPRSWLESSKHAPKQNQQGDGPGKIVHRLARLPGIDTPRPNSLLHYTLRALVKNWKWHVQFDADLLATMPTKIKEVLLSYVATYSEEGVEEGLRVLFLEEVEGASGNEDVGRLDLGNQIGRGVGLRWLKRYLVRGSDGKRESGQAAFSSTITNGMEGVSLSTPAPSPSWEDEADAEEISSPIPLTKSLPSSRFPALTHLSLAHPDRTAASWSSLLTLISNVSTLTHLSLAYWPFPTLTPNSLTTRMLPKISQGAHQPSHTGIDYGGTNYYSSAENDLSEAAGILKRLATSTYCLKWLDLEGCGDWWAALRYEQMDTDDGDISDFTSSSPRSLGPDFNTSWRSLEWIGLGVGWLPKEYEENGCSSLCHSRGSCSPSSHFNNKYDTPVDAISNPSRPYASWLGAKNRDEDMAERLRKYRRQREVEDFLALERVARGTADWIRRKRREVGGKWVSFDLRRPDGMGSAYVWDSGGSARRMTWEGRRDS